MKDMSMLDTVKAVPKTFYSKTFYAHLIRRSSGIGATFIAILVLINCVSFAVKGLPALYMMIEKVRPYINDLPITTVKDGKISIEGPTPYIIRIPTKSDLNKPEAVPYVIMIDPNYQMVGMDALIKKMQDEHILVLVTADALVTQKGIGNVKIDSLHSIPDYIVTHEKWQKFSSNLTLYFIPFIAVLLIISFTIGRFVGVFFGAITIKIFTIFMQVPPSFAAAMRLAAAASIPAAIIFSPFIPRFQSDPKIGA